MKLDVIRGMINLGIDICHKDNEGKTVLNHAEHSDLDERKEKTNPKFYQRSVTENKASETYKYLEMEFNNRCLGNE